MYSEAFGWRPVRPWQREFLLEDADIFAAHGARRTGKTEVLAFRMLAYACEFVDKLPPDDYPQLSVVPEMEQHLTFDKFQVILGRKPNPFQSLFQVIRHPRPHVRSVITGRRVVEWKSEGYDKGKSMEGSQYACIYVDEASYVSEQCVWNSLYPMLADYDGQLILTGKPYMGSANWFYRTIYGDGIKKPIPNWQLNLLKDAPTQTIARWAKKQRDIMPTMAFRQEILGEWVEESGAVFTPDTIAKAIQETGKAWGHPKAGHRYKAGIDVAVYTDYSAVVVVTTIDGITYVVDTLNFNKKELDEQAQIIAKWLKKYEPAQVMVDCTHIGEGMPALLKAALSEQGVRTLVQGERFGNNKRDYIGNVLNMLAAGTLKIKPSLTKLLDEMRTFRYELSEAGNLRMQAAPGRHDDLVMALALATTSPHVGRKSYAPKENIVPYSHKYFQEAKKLMHTGSDIPKARVRRLA